MAGEKGLYRISSTELPFEFLHGEKWLRAIYPPFGPGESAHLRGAVRGSEWREATTSELFSFLEMVSVNHNVFPFRDAHALMGHHHFRSNTAILYDRPHDQIAFVDFPEFDSSGAVDHANLLARVAAEEQGIRRVSLSRIKAGNRDPSHLLGDPFLVALSGRGGAEIAYRLAAAHALSEANIALPRIDQEPFATIPSVYSLGGRLYISGIGAAKDGYSLAVSDK